MENWCHCPAEELAVCIGGWGSMSFIPCSGMKQKSHHRLPLLVVGALEYSGSQQKCHSGYSQLRIPMQGLLHYGPMATVFQPWHVWESIVVLGMSEESSHKSVRFNPPKRTPLPLVPRSLNHGSLYQPAFSSSFPPQFGSRFSQEPLPQHPFQTRFSITPNPWVPLQDLPAPQATAG